MGLLVTLLIAVVIAAVGKYLIDMFVDDYNGRRLGYIVLGIAVLLYVLGWIRF
jgi:Na+-driven multidrug efflux pump